MADLHVSHLSSGGTGVPGTGEVQIIAFRMFNARGMPLGIGSCTRQNQTSICCLRPEEPSQKMEFVFSASPETIRREPREGDLLRSVGYRQDLAVCAFCSSCFFRRYLCCRSPAFFSRRKVSLLPIHGKQIRYHLPSYGKCRPIAISFLPFLVIDHS